MVNNNIEYCTYTNFSVKIKIIERYIFFKLIYIHTHTHTHTHTYVY